MTSAAATSIAGASAAPSSHRARRGGDARNPRRTPHPRLVRWTARTAPIDDDGDDDASALAPPRASSPSPSPSSWDAEETHARGTGEDYLYELGRQSSNLRTEVGARKGVVDDVFAGTANANFVLGADADIATGELRYTEARSLTNVVDGCYVPPRFMDKVCVHLVKNHLAESAARATADDAAAAAGAGVVKRGVGQVPLILGIWGEKGCGKSYTLELCLRAMRASPIIVSAGELDDEWAGAPGRRIRERYRAASRLMSQARSISTLVPIRSRSRCNADPEGLSLSASLSARPSIAFNPDAPRRLSTPPDAPLDSTPTFVASYDGTALRPAGSRAWSSTTSTPARGRTGRRRRR